MTALYSAELAGWGSVPKAPLPSGNLIGGNVRLHRATITLATQTTSDTILIAVPRKGDTFLFGCMTTTVTLGASATVAFGTSTSTAKYKAAATFTSADTPTLFGKAAAMTALTADEEIIVTIAVASLASSGTWIVDHYFAQT